MSCAYNFSQIRLNGYQYKSEWQNFELILLLQRFSCFIIIGKFAKR